jgi:hypothetical protein
VVVVRDQGCEVWDKDGVHHHVQQLLQCLDLEAVRMILCPSCFSLFLFRMGLWTGLMDQLFPLTAAFIVIN